MNTCSKAKHDVSATFRIALTPRYNSKVTLTVNQWSIITLY